MESMNDAMKRIQSQDLIEKLRSKEDYYRYLFDCLFLPSQEGTKISFLKALLSEEKKAFKSNEIRMIEISNYPEISLQLSNKLPERNFFFGVLGTLKSEYLNEIIQDAHKKRQSISPEEKQKQRIKISDTWLLELQKHPFISKKPGTAIHLMKECSQLNSERNSQVKHKLRKRLFKDLHKPDQMNIDAGAGTKRRNLGPSNPQEEEKKEKPNPSTGKFIM